MSQTTIFAPSSAKRTAASRPIPMPAPVMSATFPLSLVPIRFRVSLSPPRPSGGEASGGARVSRSPSPRWGGGRVRGPRVRGPRVRGPWLDSLEQPDELPVCDRLIEGLLLEVSVVEVVLHHGLPEGLARHLGALKLPDGFPERLRHLRELRILVGVAVVWLRRLELLVNSMKSRGDGGREGEVRVRVGAGNAIFHAEAAPLAAEPEAARAVVPATGDARRSERARLIALVGVDRRRVEVGDLPCHGHLSREPLLKERRPLPAVRGEEIFLARAVPDAGVEMERRARRAHLVFRHEGDGRALLPGDLLHAMLVEDVAVRHLEGGPVAEVDLLLPLAPLALGKLHGHAAALHVIADRTDERLFLGGLEDVVVLEVVRNGRELLIPLRARLVEGLAEEVELELGGGLDLPPALSRPLELALEQPPRRLLDGLALLGEHVAEDQCRLG